MKFKLNATATKPDDLKPGEWRRVADEARTKIGIFAEVCCTSCQRPMTLISKNHRINEKGELYPSLVCAFESKGCSFHVSGVILEGWNQ